MISTPDDRACEWAAFHAEAVRARELYECKRTGVCPGHDWIESDRVGIEECAICGEERHETEN